MIRRRHVTDTTGFGRPLYTAASSASQNAAAASVKPKPHVIAQHRQLALTSPLTRGADVLAVQKRLITLHYLPKNAGDGIYGPQTANAVGAFQKKTGLKPDKVCGPNTWHALHI
jgi:peptidoglycan hydrolase-like protein with peptidoglycan-binding domain